MSPNFEFVEIPPKELSEWVTILERRFPKAAQLCNIVQIQLQKDFPLVTTFFRYNGLAAQRTCFISKLTTPTKTYWCILAPICPDEEMAQVMRSYSLLVDWTKAVSLNGVDEVILDHLSAASWKRMGFSPTFEQHQHFFTMTKEVALNLELRNPPGVDVKKLRAEDMSTVFSYWTYANEDDNELELVKEAAASVASVGIFLEGQLVSFGINFRDGGIHAVHTLEEYRGHGYAKILMNYLCRWVTEQVNHFPVVHVRRDNSSSVNLMTSVGFQLSHRIVWMEFDAQFNVREFLLKVYTPKRH